MKPEITKRVFLESLSEILEETPLPDVFVVNICKHCGLSKKLFYSHFKDKYDCATMLYTKLIEKAFRGYGVTNYLEEIAAGNLDFNQVSEQSIYYMRLECNYCLQTPMTKNLLCRDDAYNSVLNLKYRALVEGKKAIMRKRAEDQKIILSERILTVGSECLLNMFDRITYIEWSKLGRFPEDEARDLVKLTNSLIDFWVSKGECVK